MEEVSHRKTDLEMVPNQAWNLRKRVGKQKSLASSEALVSSVTKSAEK